MEKLILSTKNCVPCEGGTTPLDKKQAEILLKQLDQWVLDEQGKNIHRTFKFKNYNQTIAFINAVAWIAIQEDHHPDIQFGYNQCTIHYATHAINGLSENDFICAVKIDGLLSAK